jgi:hypothetical protein
MFQPYHLTGLRKLLVSTRGDLITKINGAEVNSGWK